MTAVFAADDAEARGDAQGALDVMEELLSHLAPDEVFWRPWRGRRLLQISTLGPLLPPWVTSRWILAQALQHLDAKPGGVSGARIQRALDVAIALRGDSDGLPGVDLADATCRVMDRDWVFRQLFLYELGGLEHFLREGASADLVVGADQIRAWARTPMGAFRLGERGPGMVVWTNLSTEDSVETANIGSAALVMPGECVIGRMVPIEDGSMFEGAPMLVPEKVARRVADEPADWLVALEGIPGGTNGPACRPAGDISGLLSDVPELVWVACLGDGAGWGESSEPSPPAVVARATLDTARVALEPSRFPQQEEIEPWSCVAAALLSPDSLDGVRDIVRPSDLALLARLGDVLAEPAASWCRVLVEGMNEAA